MIKLKKRSCEARAGIALIMVVGLLALMMVLAVAFSIYMRTGRVSAGNFKNDVVTRNLLPVALNEALSSIDQSVGASAYPSWDVLCSVGVDAAPEVTNGVAMDYVPRGVIGTNTISPKWVDVTPDARVAFLVLNCSGLLDANYAGGGIRGMGTNASEIQVSAAELGLDVANFVSKRSYETIQELGVKLAPSQNLVTYSYFPWVYGGFGSVPVSLAGGTNTLINNKTSIINAFIASGFSAADALNEYNALLDYEDVDDVPQNLWSPSAESVPMFNEVQVSLKLSFSTNKLFKVTCLMDMEWYYPFIHANNSQFNIHYSLSFVANPVGFPLPSPAKVEGEIPSGYSAGKVCEAPNIVFSTNSLDYSAFYGQSVTITGQVVLLMKQASDGRVVDAVPTNATAAPVAFDFPMTFTVPLAPSLVVKNASYDQECVDPRYNWYPKEQWKKSSTPSLADSSGNNITKTFRANNANIVDGDTQMFVANSALQSVAELSYLPRSGSLSAGFWRTIQLFPFADSTISPSFDPVLNYFTFNTNTVLKGVVNPNTHSVEVMKALFTDMKADEYPGGPGAPVNAQVLAQEWVNSSGNAVTNLADLGQKCTNFMAMVGGSVFQQESVLRNVIGLVHPRQNYFNILLSVQTARTVPGIAIKIPATTISGVAEVWRDPVEINGKHAVVVRMLKTID